MPRDPPDPSWGKGHVLQTWHPGREVNGETGGEAVGTDMVFPRVCSPRQPGNPPLPLLFGARIVEATTSIFLSPSQPS